MTFETFLELHVAHLRVKGIHEEVKIAIELDKVLPCHDDPGVSVVTQNKTFLLVQLPEKNRMNTNTKEFVKHCSWSRCPRR